MAARSKFRRHDRPVSVSVELAETVVSTTPLSSSRKHPRYCCQPSVEYVSPTISLLGEHRRFSRPSDSKKSLLNFSNGFREVIDSRTPCVSTRFVLFLQASRRSPRAARRALRANYIKLLRSVFLLGGARSSPKHR